MTLPVARIQYLLEPYVLRPDVRRPDMLRPDMLRPVGGGAAPGLASQTVPNGLPESVLHKLSALLDLLVRWNERTNLTAIRDPEQIVQRHFGEGLFLAQHLSAYLPAGATLLDFGSGAGFPGIPLQLFYPLIRVTLAESQGKKSAFLREASRVLDLPSEVWANRVEKLPLARRFDVVTMRAVDEWQTAVAEAGRRVAEGGILAMLTAGSTGDATLSDLPLVRRLAVPVSSNRWIEFRGYAVPRGTSF